MAYAQILQRLLQRFFVTMGRAPLTPNEWSKLRRQAMELSRKEEGIPSVTKNTTLQDLMTGPHMSRGGPKGRKNLGFFQRFTYKRRFRKKRGYYSVSKSFKRQKYESHEPRY